VFQVVRAWYTAEEDFVVFAILVCIFKMDSWTVGYDFHCK